MVLLLLDFDGTITQHDTLASLIILAISASSSSTSPTTTDNRPSQNRTTSDLKSPGLDISNSQNTSHTSDPTTDTSNTTPANNPNPKDPAKERETALTKLWDDIVQDYVASHKKHVASYTPCADDRATLQQELEFLESVRDVELYSVGRVSRAGFFKGLGAGVLEGLGRRAVELGCECDCPTGEKEGDGWEEEKQYGGEEEREQKKGAVVVRKGFGEFVERQAARGWDVAVVSVNWSGEFIRGVVQAGCEKGQGQTRVRRVVANGIGFPDGLVEGPRELGGQPLVSAGDKLRAMRSLTEGWEEEKVVYFGDSTTDLACLVEADLGVIIADNAESKLLRTLRRVGLEASHAEEAKEGRGLIWARDFAEVLQSGVLDRI